MSLHLLSTSFHYLFLVVVTQIRGHIAGSPPVPTTIRAFHVYCEKTSALSSLVDSRRLVSRKRNSVQTEY